MSWCQRIFHNVELVRRAYLPVRLFFFLRFEAVCVSCNWYKCTCTSEVVGDKVQITL